MKYELNKLDLNILSKSSNVVIRKYLDNCLDILSFNSVPFIILSASCIGDDSIISCMNYKKLNFDIVDIVSNKFIWDEKGFAKHLIKPHIHTFNKSGISIKNNINIFTKIRTRKNIILIGDSLGDCHMADGLEYNNILKIGFLNSDVETKLETYKKHFDVVITNDSDFSFIYDLLKELK
ncbi:MAG: hypothetical protein HRU03_02600 [Nanoarchaeales archaeon]|nr:hypothetical protein [Nanoarchaeales archaeon]